MAKPKSCFWICSCPVLPKFLDLFLWVLSTSTTMYGSIGNPHRQKTTWCRPNKPKYKYLSLKDKTNIIKGQLRWNQIAENSLSLIVHSWCYNFGILFSCLLKDPRVTSWVILTFDLSSAILHFNPQRQKIYNYGFSSSILAHKLRSRHYGLRRLWSTFRPYVPSKFYIIPKHFSTFLARNCHNFKLDSKLDR